ncbi:MAG: Ppx/GppA phosphatase family protein [Christensenellales bacterium]
MRPLRAGVIGIGSNSVRMLTADLDGALSNAVRGREETALFLAMDASRCFSREGRERVAGAVGRLWGSAVAAGAGRVYLIATSAMRDAGNAPLLEREILALCPLRPSLISGEEEALLSFLGAACIPERPGLQGVIDIGGGSTEIALGSAGRGIQSARSLQLGASRLLQTLLIDGEEALHRARMIVGAQVREALPVLSEGPNQWTLVGGTGTTLAAMAAGPEAAGEGIEGLRLNQETVTLWLERLAGMDPSARAALPGLPPTRVHILPTGLVILEALMRHLSAESVSVTQRGNLDGYLWRLGDRYREDSDAQMDS